MSKNSSVKSSAGSKKKADTSAGTKSDKNSDKSSDKNSESASSADTGISEKSGSGATAKGGATARPISYFSSVATDEYREGWANIFGKPGTREKVTSSSRTRKTKKKGPPNKIMIGHSDVTEELEAHLRDALKKKVIKEKLGITRQLNKAEVSWSIECRINYQTK